MPVLCSFDTQTQGTETTLGFPRPFVARPRGLPHGIRHLDMNKDRAIVVRIGSPAASVTWDHSGNGSALYRCIDDVFALAPSDLDFLTGEHMRHLRKDPPAPASVRIDFERPFVTPPKVVVFFNHLEFDRNHNWRVVTTASDIDVNGFTLNIETWSDTILHYAQTCWIAYPEDREHIFSTSVTNPRVDAYVDDISTTRLVWHINSWHDTVLYAAGATIIAFN
ncbi:hypothetical protein EDB84DRAFT_1567413 [Lactarius hengduanensis]|nr:hypothetical protein EDB84DRAFT_1567413 [Lactarius hengduanensis]